MRVEKLRESYSKNKTEKPVVLMRKPTRSTKL